MVDVFVKLEVLPGWTTDWIDGELVLLACLYRPFNVHWLRDFIVWVDESGRHLNDLASLSIFSIKSDDDTFGVSLFTVRLPCPLNECVDVYGIPIGLFVKFMCIRDINVHGVMSPRIIKFYCIIAQDVKFNVLAIDDYAFFSFLIVD